MSKHILLSLAVLAAAVGFADDPTSDAQTSNVLGLLTVTSKANRTLISVPWCAMSTTDNQSIQISNIVKTANLTVNDTLHYVNSNGKFETWKLAENASGVKYWASVQQVGEDPGDVGDSPNPAVSAIARGGALMLMRQNPTSDGNAVPFYLFGQYTATSPSAVTVAKGAASTPAFTLIASPKDSGWKVNTDATWSGASTTDNLYVEKTAGLKEILYWDGTTWGVHSNLTKTVRVGRSTREVITGYVHVAYTDDIPAGQGIWYVSYGGEPTITWK